MSSIYLDKMSSVAELGIQDTEIRVGGMPINVQLG